MSHNQCDGCIRRLPKQHGIHMGEGEMFMCTAQRYRLELEPKSVDTWYGRKGRAEDVPFVCGGANE